MHNPNETDNVKLELFPDPHARILFGQVLLALGVSIAGGNTQPDDMNDSRRVSVGKALILMGFPAPIGSATCPIGFL